MMAIVNRTPDSFFDKGATWAEDAAFDAGAPRWSRRAPRSSTSAASRLRPGSRSSPAEEKCAASVDFVARVRAGVPGAGDLRRHLARRGRRRRVRGRCRRPQRRLGRGRSRAASTSPRSTTPPSSAPTPAASRRGPGPTASTTTTWSAAAIDRHRRATRSGRWPPASRASRSSSTRPTTSARTPSTPSRSPAGSARWSPPAGRCWSSLSNKDFVGETLGLPRSASD